MLHVATRLRDVLVPTWLPRDVSLIIAARASMSAGRALAAVVTPIYLLSIGFDATLLGVLVALTAVASAVMSAGVGLLSDRLGRRFFLIAIPLLTALGAFGFIFTRLYPLLFLFAALGSFGRGGGAGTGTVGPYQPAEQALVTDAVPAAVRNTVFGRLALASSAGALVGGLLAGLPQLAGRLALRGSDIYLPAFAVIAILALASSLIVLPVRDVARRPTNRQGLITFPRRSLPLLLKLWSTNSVNGLAVGFFGPFVTYWFFRRYGVGTESIGILYALINLASMVSNLSAAPIARRLGLIRAIVLSRILSAVLLVAVALSPYFWLAGMIYGIRMVTQRVNLPLRQSYVMAMAQPEERASVAGLSNLPAQATSSLSPLLAGYLFQSVSLVLPFELGALFQSINGVMYYFFFRKMLPPEEVDEAAGASGTGPDIGGVGRRE
ncbi:MAG: MFS transporter [Chloroflexota bacterium]